MTKYNFDISIDDLQVNIKRLTNQMWKLIPMRENGENWPKQPRRDRARKSPRRGVSQKTSSPEYSARGSIFACYSEYSEGETPKCCLNVREK